MLCQILNPQNSKCNGQRKIRYALIELEFPHIHHNLVIILKIFSITKAAKYLSCESFFKVVEELVLKLVQRN